jgi:hypothetical protein
VNFLRLELTLLSFKNIDGSPSLLDQRSSRSGESKHSIGSQCQLSASALLLWFASVVLIARILRILIFKRINKFSHSFLRAGVWRRDFEGEIRGGSSLIPDAASASSQGCRYFEQCRSPSSLKDGKQSLWIRIRAHQFRKTTVNFPSRPRKGEMKVLWGIPSPRSRAAAEFRDKQARSADASEVCPTSFARL